MNKDVKAYFIDDNIWYQGKRLEPRKVYCYNLVIDIYGYAHFNDEDGDSYKIPTNMIFFEGGK